MKIYHPEPNLSLLEPATLEEAERIASDLSYSHYKDSGAKLRHEIEAAAALERRWNPGCLS